MRPPALFALALFATPLLAEEFPDRPPRFEILPEAGHRFSFRIDGREKTAWHFGTEYQRPFFYPMNGPSGASLTRMGHPGAANHDHHRSVWFAHHDVEGHDFWSVGSRARIEQKLWLAIEEGKDEALLATRLAWSDPDGIELLEQDVVAALRPAPAPGHELEIQLTLRPAGKRPKTELGKTNFGLFSVRVAKSLSVHFGDGTLRNSEGAEGEEAIFGKQARWMDYSGPIAAEKDGKRAWAREGITFFDHPGNPRHPTHWHVRSDGWMGASFCFAEGWTVTAERPLVLRYLLHVHDGELDREAAEERFEAFAKRPGFEVGKSEQPHRQYGVWRISGQ